MGKNLPAKTGNKGDTGLIPGLVRSPGEGHGNPLQYSCLENPVDRGAWWAAVHVVAKRRTRRDPEHTSTHVCMRQLMASQIAYHLREHTS